MLRTTSAAAAIVATGLLAGCAGHSPSRTAATGSTPLKPESAPTSASAVRAAQAAPLAATTLAQRLKLSSVTLPTRLAYLESGYNYLPQYTRLGVAARANGQVLVAWPATNGTVHVTTLSATLARSGSDVVLPKSKEVGGLVAQPNGFALLTRRPDTNKWKETAAYLVRYTGSTQKFATKLTGTASHDTSPVLDGALAWNGSKYGAYFVVHGAGGFADGHFGDKLVYASAAGAKLSGGWSWGCSHNEGTALLAEKSGPFASLCFEDWRSGLFVSTGIGAPNEAPVLQREECWAGYCGGNFGNLVKSAAGRYAVAFASRGSSKVVPDGTGRGYKVTAKYAPHQLAIHYLSNKSTPTGKTIYLTSDAKTDHVNVHAAPYGPNKILLSWQSVAGAKCSAGTCTGTFTGTHLRLIDYSGHFLTPDKVVGAQIAGDIAVLPDKSLVWAFVKAAPNYSRALGTAPTSTTLTIAHLAYQA